MSLCDRCVDSAKPEKIRAKPAIILNDISRSVSILFTLHVHRKMQNIR